MKRDAKIILSGVFIIILLVCGWWLFGGLVAGVVKGNENLGNLWLVKFDGSDPQQLTNDCRSGYPIWSPDGRYLIYSTREEPSGNFVVTLISSDFPEEDGLRLPEIGTTLMAQWVPDGTEISYEGDEGLFIYNIGGVPTKIADIKEDYRNTPFAWSADGSQVAYIFPTEAGWSHFIAEIFLLSVESGEKRVLGSERMYMAEPYWSPDGKYLAILNYGHTGELSIFEVEGDGQWVSQSLPEMNIHRIFWSPDSQNIAVMECPWGSGCGYNWPGEGIVNVIFFIRPDGSGWIIAVRVFSKFGNLMR